MKIKRCTKFSHDIVDITMAPESSSADVYTDVADESFLVTVPPGVLPNGLPFGNEKYRNIWVCFTCP